MLRSVFVLYPFLAFSCRTLPFDKQNSSLTTSLGSPQKWQSFEDFDFEYSATEVNPFWFYGKSTQPCTKNFSHSISNSDRTSGHQSLSLSYSGDASCSQASYFAMTPVDISKMRGNRLVVSGDIRLDSITPLVSVIVLQINRASGSAATEEDSSKTTDWNQSSWQRVSFEVTVPDDATDASLLVTIQTKSPAAATLSGSISSKTLLDNLSIKDSAGDFLLSGSTPITEMVPTASQIQSILQIATPDVLSDKTIASMASDYSGNALVGLGEATHGTAEFQKAKIALIKELVQSHQYRAISFEEDMINALTIEWLYQW